MVENFGSILLFPVFREIVLWSCTVFRFFDPPCFPRIPYFPDVSPVFWRSPVVLLVSTRSPGGDVFCKCPCSAPFSCGSVSFFVFSEKSQERSTVAESEAVVLYVPRPVESLGWGRCWLLFATRWAWCRWPRYRQRCLIRQGCRYPVTS